MLGLQRRRWSRSEKLAAVAGTFSPGMKVTAVACELGISVCVRPDRPCGLA
ncbi:transposase [Hyphomonas sp.]|uniref:transposase n=1 Tax=Hyphomonas sp. TaxID=87 RepID=UPI0034A09A3B